MSQEEYETEFNAKEAAKLSLNRRESRHSRH
jgi:hypothetical protein